jgi:hypothetical protein
VVRWIDVQKVDFRPKNAYEDTELENVHGTEFTLNILGSVVKKFRTLMTDFEKLSPG